MCYCFYSLLIIPIICIMETVVRVIMTLVYAMEDWLRLIIKAISSWVSMVTHTIGLIPMCLVFCCSQKCFCSQICSPSCSPACYPMRNTCGCILFLTVTLVFILVYLFTNWWEDLFETLDLQFPFISEKKTDENKPHDSNKNNFDPMVITGSNLTKLTHKIVQSTLNSLHEAHKGISSKEDVIFNHITKSMKYAKKPIRVKEHELQNDLDISYIDHIMVNPIKYIRRSHETNFTSMAVTDNTIPEEPEVDLLIS